MIPDLVVIALDCYRNPARLEPFRNRSVPLPPGITELLAAPSGVFSDENVSATASVLGAGEDECRACVPFFIKQVLLDAGGDYYRTLGVARDADGALIKQHYHYLMRLFHPDRDVNDESWDDLYAPRINEAYNALRNYAKRAQYDAAFPPDDGFNPGALSQTTVEPRVVPRDSTTISSISTLSPRVRVVAMALGMLLIGVFAALVLLLDNSSTLRMGEGKVDGLVASELSPRRDDLVPKEGKLELEPDETRGVWAEVKGDATGLADSGAPAKPPRNSLSAYEQDRAVERRIQEQVARARRAALGSRASSLRRSAKPASAPAVADSLPPSPAETSSEEPQQLAGRQTPAAETLDSESGHDSPISGASDEQSAVVLDVPEISSDVPASGGLQSKPSLEVDVVNTELLLDTTPDSAILKPDIITPGELEALVRRFVHSYEAGDASAFASLFAADARTTDADGQETIYALYADFFAKPVERSFVFENVAWRDVNASAGIGDAKAVVINRPLNGEVNEVHLQMKFEVRRAENGLLITGMYY